MRRTTRVLAVGALPAAITVALSLLVEVPLVLATTGALGAAIPVSMVYAVITLETGTTANEQRSENDR